MGILDRFKKQIPRAPQPAAPVAAGKETAAAPAVASDAEKKSAVPAPLAWAQHGIVLIRPLVTEKSARQQGANQYAFMVAPHANKASIAIAVRQIYGVRPSRVNVVNVQGKQMRFGKNSGRRSDFKKAIVTLPAGASIQLHEGV